MSTLLRYFFTLLSITLSTAIFSVHALDDVDTTDGNHDIQLPLTKTTAAELVQLESNGKILAVNEQQKNGLLIFKIKVLHNNGKIKVYKIDPTTGHAP